MCKKQGYITHYQLSQPATGVGLALPSWLVAVRKQQPVKEVVFSLLQHQTIRPWPISTRSL